MTTVDTALRIAPWITLWSDEYVPARDVMIQPGLDRVRYVDEHPADWFMGVLWHRERIGMTGKPIFAQVHCRRQRRAIVDPRCQVCGERLAKTNVPFLIPPDEMDVAHLNGWCTITAPTCLGCQDDAVRRCPHLRTRGFTKVTAESTRPVGILGDLYHPLSARPRLEIPFGDPVMPHMIAKQLIVQLLNPTVHT